MLSKLKTAIKKPEAIPPYLRDIIYSPLKLSALMHESEDGYYKIELEGYELIVDLNDKGIGQELAISGIREPISYTEYREQLRKQFSGSEGPINVLEVGGNIGYYALAAASDLNSARIFAVEADPDNADLLKRNVKLNNYEDIFTIDCIAFGEENKTKDIYQSSHSNLHSLQSDFAELKPDLNTETSTVKVTTGKSWLKKHGLSTSEIDILRMDVEGYEAKVLSGLEDIFDNGPILVHMEVHPKLMDEQEISYIKKKLEGLEIIVAARDKNRVAAEDISEVMSFPWAEFVGIKR